MTLTIQLTHCCGQHSVRNSVTQLITTSLPDPSFGGTNPTTPRSKGRKLWDQRPPPLSVGTWIQRISPVNIPLPSYCRVTGSIIPWSKSRKVRTFSPPLYRRLWQERPFVSTVTGNSSLWCYISINLESAEAEFTLGENHVTEYKLANGLLNWLKIDASSCDCPVEPTRSVIQLPEQVPEYYTSIRLWKLKFCMQGSLMHDISQKWST